MAGGGLGRRDGQGRVGERDDTVQTGRWGEKRKVNRID
jgi:hypothetical protein